jgi:soluble lytic murein transglycosylase-like protein
MSAKPYLVFAIASLFVPLAFSGMAAAQSGSVKSRTGLSKAQIKLLDGRLSKQYENSKRLLPTNKDIPRYTGAYKGEYLPMAEKAAAKFGVPKELFARLIQMESNWNPKALSPAGAIGLAQLLPQTAAKLGVDPFDPQANLEGGALYLKQQFTRFRSWKLAIAAYNAGPEAVAQYNDVPPFSETQAYVLTILGR